MPRRTVRGKLPEGYRSQATEPVLQLKSLQECSNHTRESMRAHTDNQTPKPPITCVQIHRCKLMFLALLQTHRQVQTLQRRQEEPQNLLHRQRHGPWRRTPTNNWREWRKLSKCSSPRSPPSCASTASREGSMRTVVTSSTSRRMSRGSPLACPASPPISRPRRAPPRGRGGITQRLHVAKPQSLQNT